MANSMLHYHGSHIWVYMKHCTLSDLFCPHNSSRGRYCLLPCKTEKTEVHRDIILSPLLYLTILYSLPGENYSLMDELSTSPRRSIYPVILKALQFHRKSPKEIIILKRCHHFPQQNSIYKTLKSHVSL